MNLSRVFPFLLIATLTFLGVAGCKGPQKKAGPLELEVATMEVQPQEVVVYQDFVGTVNGIENAEIRARVAGYLEEVHFKEGARVEKGELLFTIDPVLSEAEVRKARGDVAMAQASLAKSQADVDRLAPLVATNAVSRQELEHAQAPACARPISPRDDPWRRPCVASRDGNLGRWCSTSSERDPEPAR
jgi:membrane fusion protein (multidrug efflux system)